jgi:hypothetical protein
MTDQPNAEGLTPETSAQDEYSQLYQARVPLDDAADGFNLRDASSRTPIVVTSKRLNRVKNGIVAAAVLVFLASLIVPFIFPNWVWMSKWGMAVILPGLS